MFVKLYTLSYVVLTQPLSNIASLLFSFQQLCIFPRESTTTASVLCLPPRRSNHSNFAHTNITPTRCGETNTCKIGRLGG